MKMIVVTVMAALCGMCGAATTELFTVQFDLTKISAEQRGAMTLFKYNDPQCTYVEHGPGTPVLPSVIVQVVMAKGARFKSCHINAQTQPVRGTFKMYARAPKTTQADAETTAQRYPARLVEFIGQRDVEGYRVFSFRTYPVMCQPADGSVTKVLAAHIEVLYEGAAGGMYAPAAPDAERRLRSMVMNPDAIAALTEYHSSVGKVRPAAVVAGRAVATRDVFATQADPKPVVSATPPSNGDVFDMLKENVYINEDNHFVYAPIRF